MATKAQVSVDDQQHIIGELLQFVDKNARADLRLNAIDYLFAVRLYFLLISTFLFVVNEII
jgi:hypothetical protein